MLANVSLYSVGAGDLHKLALEGHGAAKAFDAPERLYVKALEVMPFHLLHIPFFVDGREFSFAANPDTNAQEYYSDYGWEVFSSTYFQRALVACAHAFAAERAVYAFNFALAFRYVNMVRALLVAEAAAGAKGVVLDNVDSLKPGLSAKDFQKISAKAQGAKKDPPGQVESHFTEYPPYCGDTKHPGPELQGVGHCAKRADVFAPEHIHKQTTKYHKGNCGDGHPKSYFSLEAGCNCVIRVQVLAEKLTGSGRHVEDPEYQRIFDYAEDFVCHAAVFDIDGFYADCVAKLHKKVFHCANRAQIAAEQFAEQDHSRRKGNSQDYLQGTHAAGKRASYKECCKGLKAAHGAQCLRVCLLHVGDDNFDKSSDKENYCCQSAPLKDVTWPVGLDAGWFFHWLQYNRNYKYIKKPVKNLNDPDYAALVHDSCKNRSNCGYCVPTADSLAGAYLQFFG